MVDLCFVFCHAICKMCILYTILINVLSFLIRYLSELKLPKRMSSLRDGIQTKDGHSSPGEDEGTVCLGEACTGTIRSFPFDVGDLQIVNLGKSFNISRLLPVEC